MRIMYDASQQNGKLMEQRTPGEHVWLAFAMFRLDPKNLRKRDAPVHMDRENLADIQIGCYVCEQPYTQGAEAYPCPGEPDSSVPEIR